MSERNGKVYFGFPYPPWCNVVYEVDPEAVGVGSVVTLPGDAYTALQLLIDEGGRLIVSDVSTLWSGESRHAVYEAVLVLDTNAEGPTFSGEWETILWQLNAAAATNCLFVVYLPQGEYQRLAADDGAEFEALKTRMSPRAASLVQLEPDYYDEPTPVVWLLRTGSCPG